MIAIIDGIVAEREEDALVMMVGGIGYRVFVPKPLLQTVTTHESMRLYTHLVVREDAFLLFGFSSLEERQLFLRLQNANGVGPKLAQLVLSHLSVEELFRAIAEEDVKKLSKVPGVGAKTASRIVLELKGSLDTWDNLTKTSATDSRTAGESVTQGPLYDLQEALLQLGFSDREVAPVLAQIAPEIAKIGLNEGMRRALRSLGR